jgi:F0F1-type ATP synthase assembly protein I
MNSLKKDETLTKRIDNALAKEGEKKTTLNNNQNLLNTFSKVATELLAGLLIGGGIGWTIDKWLGTNPWFLVIFFLLGGAAGILNLWRVVTGKGLKIGYF